MFWTHVLQRHSIVGQECMAPPHMSLLSEPHYRDRHPEGYHVGYVSFDVSQLGRKKGRYTFTSRANVDEVINCTSALIARSPIKSCIYKLYRGATSLRFSDTHSQEVARENVKMGRAKHKGKTGRPNSSGRYIPTGACNYISLHYLLE